MKTVDYLIVGGGIAGASVAYELAAFGQVCVLEAESVPGYHTTGRSAALFAPTYGGKEIRAITRASQDFFENPPAAFSATPLLRERGCLYVARTDQQNSLQAMVDDIRASGGNVSTVTPQKAAELVPLLRPNYVSTAAFDEDARDIDVNALHQGFLRGAKARGAIIKTNSRVENVSWRHGLWNVDLKTETLSAPILVNAAGAWADILAITCNAAPVRLKPFRRTAVLVTPPSCVNIGKWPCVIDSDEQFYFKPDAGKLLLSPADETPDIPCDAQPDDLDIAIGVDRIQTALDIEVRRIDHRWAGLRTFSPDRIPVIGYDPTIAGFFWCAGQGGYGIQTAPAMGRIVSGLVRRAPLPTDVMEQGLTADAMSPYRFFESAEPRRQVEA